MQISMKHSKSLFVFFFLAILTLALIIAVWLRLEHISTRSLWADEAYYAHQARNIVRKPACLASKEMYQYHPPLFPVLLIPGILAADDLTGFRIITLLINLAGILVMYFLGRCLRNRFAAVFCMLGLAFNYLNISTATRILVDSPLAVFLMVFMLAWFKWHASEERRHHFYLGFLSVLIVFLKSSGVLILPLLLLLSILSRRSKEAPPPSRYSLIPLILALAAWALTLGVRYLLCGHWWYDLSALQGRYLIKPWWYFIAHFHDLLMLPYLLPFLIIGLMVVFRENSSSGRGLLAWFFVILVSLSIVPEKALRYALMLIPPILLITAIGMDAALSRIFRPPDAYRRATHIILMLIVLSYLGFVPKIRGYLEGRYSTYWGYDRAAQYIESRLDDNMLLICRSPRHFRFWLGDKIEDKGGRIVFLPDRIQDLRAVVRTYPGPLFVQLDAWTGKDVDPVSIQKVEGLGPKLVSVIRENVGLSFYDKRRRPVIWLFYRPAQNKANMQSGKQGEGRPRREAE